MEAVLLSRDILLTLHRRAPCPETVSLLEWLISMIDPVEVDAVRNAIINTIDVDATASTGEITIRLGICSQLDKLRNDFSVLPDVLRAVGRVILDETEMPQVLVALSLSLSVCVFRSLNSTTYTCDLHTLMLPPRPFTYIFFNVTNLTANHKTTNIKSFIILKLSVEYLSQIGFLVTFPEELASYAPNSFEFCFQANGQLFCK